jgi:plastocyanin
MMAKQPLKIRNDDDTLHNVHAMPTKSKEFNIGQPNKGMETTRTFASPEVMVKFKCDVHPWMAAYVGVLDHPFFATTGEDGSFTIKDLPPGTYEIVAWHEKLGEQTAKVTVADAPVTQEFTFKPVE